MSASYDEDCECSDCLMHRLKSRQKEINEVREMTREEAIKKFHEITYPETYDDVGVTLGSAFHRDRKWAEKAIAGFEALGLMKFKEPEEGLPIGFKFPFMARDYYIDCVNALRKQGWTITKL